jgi:hypothetical protein
LPDFSGTTTLARMIARAWMLLAAALVSPAWSQETASIDLHSASVRQIVRDTAATQYAPVLTAEEVPPPRKPATLEDEEAAPIESPPTLRAPGSAPAPPAPRWFRILFEAANELLEPDEDLESEARYRAWNFCLANNRDKPTDQRNRSCSQVAGGL